MIEDLIEKALTIIEKKTVVYMFLTKKIVKLKIYI